MPRFVVHEHHASHLHWDFRLELEGVLKSWAIPKKPDVKEGEKQLAIQVDDHDLDYIDFEGEIPEGSYGAGRVRIWDKGTFKPMTVRKDKVEIELKGKRLNGIYYLIQFNKASPKDWLFFRKKVS